MKKTTDFIMKAMVTALTGLITIMPLFTCVFFVHQPKLPEEINDFRKYDK